MYAPTVKHARAAENRCLLGLERQEPVTGAEAGEVRTRREPRAKQSAETNEELWRSV